MDLLAYFNSSIALILVFLLYYIVLRRNKVPNVKILPPEAAGSWPIIGHLPQLAKPELPHIILGTMADKYGSIYSIRLGIHQAVVVSSWQIAKELFTIKDMVVASRPKLLATKIMGYNYAMFAFAPYGPYWREVRKMAVLELLSNHRIELLKHVICCLWGLRNRRDMLFWLDKWLRNEPLKNKFPKLYSSVHF